MKIVRIWFEKDAECRFISHLDLNRVILRAIHKSKLPVWHTEGFNPHPFATFALPLSLGFRGKYECLDVKLDENYPLQDIPDMLNACLPNGICVYKATDAVMKAGAIAFAKFNMILEPENVTADVLFDSLDKLLNMQNILVDKKSKSGIKQVDIKPYIGEYSLNKAENSVTLDIILPAGSVENINPSLIVTALENYFGAKVFADITRTAIYNSNMDLFI